MLLRARYDGTNVIGEFSPDDGETWTLIGQEGHAAPLQAPLRVGLAAFRGGNGGGTASFDWFRVHAGSEAGGPTDCAGGGSCNPLSDQFEGTALDPKWELLNPHPDEPAGRGGRPSDAPARPGRSVRRQRQRPDAAPAGARGLVGGDGEDRAREHRHATARRPGWR